MEKVKCPHCREIVEPTVVKIENVIIAIECTECGYDMKKEVMEARSD